MLSVAKIGLLVILISIGFLCINSDAHVSKVIGLGSDCVGGCAFVVLY